MNRFRGADFLWILEVAYNETKMKGNFLLGTSSLGSQVLLTHKERSMFGITKLIIFLDLMSLRWRWLSIAQATTRTVFR